MTYRISIDTSLCCGYGGCVPVAPGTFALENGLAVLRAPETCDESRRGGRYVPDGRDHGRGGARPGRMSSGAPRRIHSLSASVSCCACRRSGTRNRSSPGSCSLGAHSREAPRKTSCRSSSFRAVRVCFCYAMTQGLIEEEWAGRPSRSVSPAPQARIATQSRASAAGMCENGKCSSFGLIAPPKSLTSTGSICGSAASARSSCFCAPSQLSGLSSVGPSAKTATVDPLERLAVPADERGRVPVPAAHVERPTQNDGVVDARVVDGVDRPNLDVGAARVERRSDGVGDLLRRAALARIGDQHLHHVLLSAPPRSSRKGR